MPRRPLPPAPAGPANAAGPRRTCVGCGARDVPGAMVRFVLGPGGEPLADPSSFGAGPKAAGRGAHAHPRPACLRAAAQKGLPRSFKRPVRARAEALAAAVREGSLGRAAAQLGAAAARGLAGAEPGGGAALTVVACDCPPEAFGPPLREAVGRGKAVAFGRRESLGALFGRGALSMVFVRDAGVAEKIARACAVADGAGPGRAVSEVG
ncbi:MAG TPA: YlxR family protein [Polyangiaceae bacterium]|nr:YlxR family protein [Polyangiaceae bacterium]